MPKLCFFSRLHEISQVYRLTETMGVGTSTDTQEESRHYCTTGLWSPNTEEKIVDPDSGNPLPLNKRGEMWLRGPYVMKGMFFWTFFSS